MEETYSQGTGFTGTISFSATQLTYKNKTYQIGPNDEVILYERVGDLNLSETENTKPQVSFEKTSNQAVYFYEINSLNIKLNTQNNLYKLKPDLSFNFDLNTRHNTNNWLPITSTYYEKIVEQKDFTQKWKFLWSYEITKDTAAPHIFWFLKGPKDGEEIEVNYNGSIQLLRSSLHETTTSFNTPIVFDGFLIPGWMSNQGETVNWKVWGLFSFPYMRGIYTTTPNRETYGWQHGSDFNTSSGYTAHITPRYSDLYGNESQWENYKTNFAKKLQIFTNSQVTANDATSIYSWGTKYYFSSTNSDLSQWRGDEEDLSAVGWKLTGNSFFYNYKTEHTTTFNYNSYKKTFYWCFLPNEKPAYAVVIWKNGKLLENS